MQSEWCWRWGGWIGEVIVADGVDNCLIDCSRLPCVTTVAVGIPPPETSSHSSMVDGGEKPQEVFILLTRGDVAMGEKGHGDGVELAIEGSVVIEGCEWMSGLLDDELLITCKGEDEGEVGLGVEAEDKGLEAAVGRALWECGKDLPLAPGGGVWCITNGVVDMCSLLDLALSEGVLEVLEEPQDGVWLLGIEGGGLTRPTEWHGRGRKG